MIKFASGLFILLVVGTVTKAEEAPATKWIPLFDGKSLKGWKEADFYKPGKCKVENGCILLEKGSKLTGITLDKKDFPKENYEVSFEAKRVEGRDFFCTTTFPVGKAFTSFVVGGWGGTVVGISGIDGVDASENSTGQGKEFKDGQWYKIRILVAGDKLQTWIDNEQVVDLKISENNFTLHISCNVCKPFGIATYDTIGAIRDLKYRNILPAELKK